MCLVCSQTYYQYQKHGRDTQYMLKNVMKRENKEIRKDHAREGKKRRQGRKGGREG